MPGVEQPRRLLPGCGREDSLPRRHPAQNRSRHFRRATLGFGCRSQSSSVPQRPPAMTATPRSGPHGVCLRPCLLQPHPPACQSCWDQAHDRLPEATRRPQNRLQCLPASVLQPPDRSGSEMVNHDSLFPQPVRRAPGRPSPARSAACNARGPCDRMTCSFFSTCSSPGCSLTRSAKAEKRGSAAPTSRRRSAHLEQGLCPGARWPPSTTANNGRRCRRDSRPRPGGPAMRQRRKRRLARASGPAGPTPHAAAGG